MAIPIEATYILWRVQPDCKDLLVAKARTVTSQESATTLEQLNVRRLQSTNILMISRDDLAGHICAGSASRKVAEMLGHVLHCYPEGCLL